MHHGISLARVSPIPPVTGMAVTVLDPVITKIVILMYHSILQNYRVSPIPPSSLVTGVAVVLDPAFITKINYHI